MGASQERAAFFNASFLVVTRHPGGPPGRPKIYNGLLSLKMVSLN
jgi:hypothetical protein